MRKNSNNQTRSYFLFEFEDIKGATRAKIELNRRRDILGDKRAEITLLMNEEFVMKGRNFEYTRHKYQGDLQTNKVKTKK